MTSAPEPLLHPKTSQNVADFLANPSHALLISGPVGSGKGYTASYIASQLLDISLKKLTDHPYVSWLHDQAKAISIEDIRSAQNFMQLRVPGTRPIRRVLIVEQGETMGTEAQNAFLKLLEEPPQDSVIIITATGREQVLPTIRSRTQQLSILPPNEAAIHAFFGTRHPSNAIVKAYHLSEGYMGLMHALLSEDQEHPLVQQITVAKTILGGSLYERLCKVDEITKNKNIALLLQAMERVSHAALSNAIANNIEVAKRWTKRLRAITAAQVDAQNSVQGKLLLTHLMLSL